MSEVDMSTKDVLSFVNNADLMVLFCYKKGNGFYVLASSCLDSEILVGACIRFESAEDLQSHCVDLIKEVLVPQVMIVDMTLANRVKEDGVQHLPTIKYEQVVGEERGMYEGHNGVLPVDAFDILMEHPVIAVMLSGDHIPEDEYVSIEEATDMATWRIMKEENEEDATFVIPNTDTVN